MFFCFVEERGSYSGLHWALLKAYSWLYEASPGIIIPGGTRETMCGTGIEPDWPHARQINILPAVLLNWTLHLFKGIINLLLTVIRRHKKHESPDS